ncbi:MAG: AIR synthase family protein [Candidatus Promineifilaceae bacterium]|nr:AIR synthase family protein [Candidatus Promineifilaceae bacterium]
MSAPLAVGKLPFDLLRSMLAGAPIMDERVLLGPGVGVDCAVIDIGERLLVLKSDPITFATAEIGWYLVQVNGNDIAAMGARPRWLLLTMLLPEAKSTRSMVSEIAEQVYTACRALGISVIGGHSEVTYGLQRPILMGTLIGEVARERLVTPQGMEAGDRILLTKGVPIEGTAILAREYADRLQGKFSPQEIRKAQNFLYDPGISVLRDAEIAQNAGRVTAMHDPTEGGLIGALWELAEASACSLLIDPTAVHIPPLSSRVCRVFDLDPLATIASGALLLTAPMGEVAAICAALEGEGIPCAEVGRVAEGPPSVWQETVGGVKPLERPTNDEISKVVAS